VRCGLLLQMMHVAWSVCLSVCLSRVSCAKTAEPIEVPFGGLTLVGPRNHVLDGGLRCITGRAILRREDVPAIVTYLRVIALQLAHTHVPLSPSSIIGY